jgi:uncharacterized protein (TIGR03084 family)
MADLHALADDAQAEHDVLADLLRDRPDEDWDRPTPAPRWTVRDQISHLAFFDHVTRLAVADHAAFGALRDEALQDLEGYVEKVLSSGAGRSGTQMLEWWARERADLVAAVRAADPSQRVPWFGPSMSLASKTTARIMETWAHGQDVVDALGIVRPPSARLAHVARIGVLALPNSYRARGRDVPDVPVRVALDAPDGSVWAWGPEDSADVVAGPAEDFCLVVTQRRHVDDTALHVTGPVATEWVSIAQAFAGPPGEGRAPGQFRAGAPA